MMELKRTKIGNLAEIMAPQGLTDPEAYFGLYMLSYCVVPDKDEDMPGQNVEDRYVIGTEQLVRRYLEHWAEDEYPKLSFTWEKDSLDSEPNKGNIMHFSYESTGSYNGRLHAILLPAEIIKFD